MRRSLFWVLAAVALPAAAGDFGFSGLVIDENNAPVAGARVSAASAAGAVHAFSDLKGAFRLRLPAAGSYAVQVDRDGYFRLSKQLELPATGVSLILNHTRELYQSIDVPAQLTAIDPDRTTREKRLSDLQMIAVPYPRTNSLRNALRLMPGVVQDNAGGLHVDGGSEDQVLYTLDGFNIADPLTGRFETRLGVEAVRSIEVSSGRFSPEFGKGSAGAVALKTLMGDDRLRYGATNFFPGIENHKGLQVGNWTPRVTVTGPVARGRAWFSSALDMQYDRNVVEELPKGQDTSTNLRMAEMLRTQVNLTPSNILFAGLLVNHSAGARYGLTLLDPVDTTLNRRSRQWFAHVKDQIYVAGGVLIEAGYAANRTFGREIPQGTGFLDITTEGKRGYQFVDATRKAARDQWLGNIFLPPLEAAGSHRLKAGFDLDRLGYWQDTRRTGYDVYRLDGSVSRRVRFAGNGRFSRDNFEAAAYVQDAWHIRPSLLLDFGARLDHDRLLGATVPSPRVGFGWSPGGAANLRISGGYGIIHDATSLRLFTRPLDQHSLTTYYWKGEVVRGPAVALYHIDPELPLLSPRYRTLALSLEQRLPGDFMMRADWLRKRGENGFTYAGAPEAPPELQMRFPRMPFDAVYRLGNSRRDVFDSFSVAVRKSFARQYEFMAAYTRSRALSNAVVDVNIDDPLIVSSNVGPMPWDAPNRFQSWGYLPTKWSKWSLAYLLEVRDGFPFSIQDDIGALIGDLNSQRFPLYFELNVHLERKLSLKGHFWAFRFGCNNIAGHRNPTVVNANNASPNFMSFYGGQGRTLNFRLRWLGKTNR
ncbi:MAG: carboxypeptidase regulatory-like domain-containing protein [Bryobacteraceae bacterium]